MTDVFVGEQEVLEDLGGGLAILRERAGRAYTADSVLLADFAGAKKGDRVCDLGAGGGILPLLLCARQPEIIVDGVEISATEAERASRSVRYNSLQDKIHMICASFGDVKTLFPPGGHTLIVSNPPYFDAPDTTDKRMPEGALDELFDAAAYLLGHHGRMALCYPAARLTRALSALAARRLEPKTLRFVYGKPGKDAYLALILAVKGARPGLIVPPPLFMRGEDGAETEEIKRIYRM